MMGAFELATAMMYGINVVVIVVNDNALTAIKGSQQQSCNGRTIDTELLNPDFVECAKSFGAYAVRVNNPAEFKRVLQGALAMNKPALIEVPMGDKQEELISTIGWLQSQPLLRK